MQFNNHFEWAGHIIIIELYLGSHTANTDMWDSDEKLLDVGYGKSVMVALRNVMYRVSFIDKGGKVRVRGFEQLLQLNKCTHTRTRTHSHSHAKKWEERASFNEKVRQRVCVSERVRVSEGCQKSFSCMVGSLLSPFFLSFFFHLGALEKEM